jgi:transcriptional regulator with XRE-family HTH domain
MISPIGKRIYELRTDRTPKLTQQELAERAGISVDVIQKLEQGRKQSARITTLTAIARVLDVDLAMLLGRPTRLESVPDDGGLLQLRRALTPVAPLDTSADVGDELAEAWPLYWVGDYDRLVSVLPGILAAASGDQAAEAHALAASALVHLGHCDLALLALRAADELVQDELLAVELCWNRAWVLLCQGRPEDGTLLSTRVLDGTPVGRRDSGARVSAWGVLAVTAATAAARAGDSDQASELLRAAQAAVTMDGRGGACWPAGRGSWFGPAKVAMMETDCAVVAGDYPAALEAARRMPPRSVVPLASWARHRTDVAWAGTQLGRRDEAEETLLELAAEAPRWIRYQTFPRAVTAGLLSGRRVSPELRELARSLRVDGSEQPEGYV